MYQRKFKRVDPCPKNCEKKEGCTFNAQVSWDTVEKNRHNLCRKLGG